MAYPDPGALSYRHPQTGEWAHDVRDPLAEAEFAFVQPALEAVPPRGKGWRILEVGFGRGLNTAVALATLAAHDWKGSVDCLGLEPFPERLEPWPALPSALRGFAPWWGREPAPWSMPDRAWSGQILTAPAPQGLVGSGPWDWVFVDLFSPRRHPQDWANGLFRTLRREATAGAVLTSYCCARAIRERAAAAGWTCQVLRRPGRRDSLRALALASPSTQD